MRRVRYRGWLLMLGLFVGTFVLGAIQESRAGGDLVWARSYADGLKQAKTSGKWIIVSLHSPGCGWCKKLDAETFTDPTVVDLSKRFVCVRVDSDVDGKICDKLNVFEYPTLLIEDPLGREVGRVPGFIAPDRFAEMLRALLKAAPHGGRQSIAAR